MCMLLRAWQRCDLDVLPCLKQRRMYEMRLCVGVCACMGDGGCRCLMVGVRCDLDCSLMLEVREGCERLDNGGMYVSCGWNKMCPGLFSCTWSKRGMSEMT